MRRLHIVGCPRSGTTLMLQLLATGFHVDGLCEFEMDIYQEPPRENGLYLSKRPTDIKIIAPILKADPYLYVLHMVRDPRSVTCSIHKSVPGKYFCHFALWLECDLPARQLIGHERFIVVRYEDLVHSPNATQRHLMQKFPFLQKRREFSQYHQYATPSERSLEAMNGLRPVTSERIESWREHLPRVKAQLITYPKMLEALQFYGYEKDHLWTAVLNSVVPEFTESRHRTHKNILKYLDWKFRNWRKLRKKLKKVKRYDKTQKPDGS